MALTSWKVFNFFDVSPVSLPDPSLFDSSNLSSLTTGSESLFLGTHDGRVHMLSSSFKLVRSFAAYEPDTGAITHMRQIHGTALLLTIAEDLSNEPRLKVWALDKIDKKTNAPSCLSSLSVQNGRKNFPISAVAALNDLSQVAVGFGNGAVTLIRGDLIHDRGARQRTVFESAEPITGVEFRAGSALTTLYLATTGRILTLTVSGRGQGQPARPLDDLGCGLGCITLDPAAGDIIVARPDRISYYGPRGRGPAYAYESPKQLVRCFRQYVALVAPLEAPAGSKTLRLFGGQQADEIFNTTTFAILDTDLQFVAHTESLSAQVREVFAEWDDLFVLTVDGKIYRYHEKKLQSKLDILYQRNLYILAINLAQKVNLGAAQRNLILRKYGDYLYQKGDYDTAMQQYLKAIDNTEPSQVIRKFLDTQRIHNLIQYLEELHEHDRATVDHTTLLLNCYAKLKDTAKLEAFINSDSNFDFETAIAMCRQGGYHEQAAFLARKHGEHELVIDILVEDLQRYDEALNYLWRLDASLTYPNLMKYARVFLEHAAASTTQLFIDYYTGKYKPKTDEPAVVAVASPGASSGLATLSSFIPLPYRQAPSSSSKGAKGSSKGVEDDGSDAGKQEDETPAYPIPKPRTAFSAFVDHPESFLTFLEALVRSSDLDSSDQVDLHTTLFEMYLDAASRRTGGEKADFEAKARKLVDAQKVSIDPSNVLLLSHLAAFDEGTVLVREQQGLRFDIFRSYTSANDTAGALKALRKYGPEEPGLYSAALAYLTSTDKIMSEAGDEVDFVLNKIDTEGLMSPLQVIQLLSRTQVAKMRLVKRYLGKTIEQDRREIDDNRRLADTYRAATATKREEIATLATKPAVFQNRRCSLCGASLDLPTVHFLCKHSFHQRCLNEPTTPHRSAHGGRHPGQRNIRRGFNNTNADDKSDEDDDDTPDVEPRCPICAKENDTLRAIRRAQIESATRHDMFRDALHRSQDGLATVGEFLGRGVMDVGSPAD